MTTSTAEAVRSRDHGPSRAAGEGTGSTRPRDPETQLGRVPAPPKGAAVVPLGGRYAGGLEAIQAEWGPGGGIVLLTGQRSFTDVTGRAGFRSDGTLDGSLELHAAIGFLGLRVAEARWRVDGWTPDAPVALPSAALRGTTLDVDLDDLPPETSWTPREGLESARDGTRARVHLPTQALPPGEPLSPRLAEAYRGLLGIDPSSLRVHRDAPVGEAPAFVTDAHLFFAPGVYGVDAPETLAVLDAAIRAAVSGLVGAVGESPPDDASSRAGEPSTQPPPGGPTSRDPVPATAPGARPVAAGATGGAARRDATDGGVAAGEPRGTEERAADVPDGVGAEAAAGAEGADAETVAVELIMPEPPSALSPAAAERGSAVSEGARRTARKARDLPSAGETVAESRGAVTEPVAETAARAREALAAELGERPAPSPEIVELCERIRTAIRENRPEDEDELLETDPADEASDAGATVTSSVQGQSEEVSGSFDALSDPPAGTPELTPTPIEPPSRSAPGMRVDAASAAPDPIPAEDTSLDADLAATDERIASSGIDTRVTQEIPDGPFGEARAARGELGQAAERTPQEIQAQQQEAIESAQADMAALQARAVEVMQQARAGTVGDVGSGQSGMVASEEQTRESVSQRAQGIYDLAQQRVEEQLRPLSRKAIKRWETGLAALSQEFDDTLAQVKRWIDKRHSGVGGSILAIGDYFTGLPGWVTREYNRAERRFGDGVCDLLLEISSDVNGVVAAAQAIIAQARDDIDAAFTAMEAEFPDWADQERARFGGMLDRLSRRVTDAQTGFVDDVSERAVTAVNEVHAEAQSRRDEAGGLVGRVVAAIGEFIEDPVRAIINGLLSLAGIPPADFWALVARIEEVAADIADDPERFINNLVAGLRLGFEQFFDHFGTHVLAGFWEWLFSGLETDIAMPTELSATALFSFALELMGITWARVREILVRHLGPEAVELIETVWELVSTLIEQGPDGLVEMVREQLTPESIVATILEAAVDYLVDTLIEQVIVRVVGMLNPVGAVAQAIDLIYQVCAWVFRNAARIFRFVEAVVNGMADVLAGNIGGLAGAVEQALASLIPPVIDFLAGLMHMGDLPAEVAGVIVALQATVYAAMDRVIGFLVEQGRALLARLGVGGEEDEQEGSGDDGGDDELGTTVRFAGGGEGHRLWFDLAGADATLMVASVTESVAAKVAGWRGRLDEVPEEERGATAARLDALDAVVGAADAEGDSLAAAFLQAAADADDGLESPSDHALENRQRAIAGMLGELFEIFEGADHTEKWLADMRARLPGWGTTYVAERHGAWEERMLRFQIGNEEDDPLLWPATTLAGTESDALRYISDEGTHRLLLPYFQAAPGDRRVVTGAFREHVFVQAEGDPVRRDFRLAYGEAAVTKLKSVASDNIADAANVEDGYKKRLQGRVDAMSFMYKSPGGGRIVFPTERIPDHRRYAPLDDIVETESDGVRTTTYRTQTGQTFTATRDAREGLTMTVEGRNLRFRSQRGRGETGDSPLFTSGNGFDRSHVIADEFAGSGFPAGRNLVTASARYNQQVMRAAECEIGLSIRATALAEGLDETTVSFDMAVTVTFGALRDPEALAEAKALPDFPADRVGTDLDAEILAKIKSGQVHENLMRINGVEYRWTFTDLESPFSGWKRIGADLWLLTHG